MSTYLAGRPPAAGPMEPIRPSPAPARVAWGLVTSCASAMVLADGFLVVALRGVAGSIERTDHLFLAWIRESMLLLPAFVVAVLLAVTWAQRRWRATSVMIGSIALAGTLAGQLWATVSAVYDFRLQQHELLDMPAMQAACTGTCPPQMQHASIALQGRALGLAAVAFLVGNLLVVLWVYALRGGVLVPPHPSRGEPRRPLPVQRLERITDLRWVMTASLLGAAVIHAAVAPEHLREWPQAGAFFVLLAVAELGAAILIGVRHSSKTVAVVGLLSVLPLALWGFSRTHGVPFGPRAGVPETIGFADIATCVLEVVTVVACLLTIRSHGCRPRPAAAPYTIALRLTSLLAVTFLGLGGTALPGVHSFGVAGHGEGPGKTAVPSTRLPGSLVPPSQLDDGSR